MTRPGLRAQGRRDWRALTQHSQKKRPSHRDAGELLAHQRSAKLCQHHFRLRGPSSSATHADDERKQRRPPTVLEVHTMEITHCRRECGRPHVHQACWEQPVFALLPESSLVTYSETPGLVHGVHMLGPEHTIEYLWSAIRNGGLFDPNIRPPSLVPWHLCYHAGPDGHGQIDGNRRLYYYMHSLLTPPGALTNRVAMPRWQSRRPAK